MKYESRNIGLLLVAVSAIISASAFAALQTGTLQAFDNSPKYSGAFMTGHVQAIVYDDVGNILAYRQADNAIVNNGMDIIAAQLFRPGVVENHTNDSAGFGGGRVGFMSIGNNTTPTAPGPTNSELDCPLVNGLARGCNTANLPACVAQDADIGSSGGRVGPGGGAQINVTAIATFDGGDCTSKAINEAGLWNNSTTGNGRLFARNTFGDVTLTSTDSLELTWRFTFTDSPFP